MSDIVTLNGYNIKDEKAVRSYESIASMKADTKLKEGYHVKTKGYYEVNDGGHGEYVIVDDDSLVDDGGSIHVLSNGLRAKLIINKTINSLQFGIKSNGINDDLLSLNKLISFINNYNDYLEVIFNGKNTTLFSDTLVILKSNLKIILNNNLKLTKTENISSSNALKGITIGTDSQRLTNVIIEGNNHYIDGNGSAVTLNNSTTSGLYNAKALHIINVDNITINNLIVKNGYKDCCGITNCSNGLISNCTFDSSYRDNGLSIGSDDINEPLPIKVNNCLAINCRDLGFSTWYGKNVIFNNCVADNCGNSGETQYDSTYVSAGGGYSSEVPSSSVENQVSNLSTTFVNCIAKNCKNYGFYFNTINTLIDSCNINNIIPTGTTTLRYGNGIISEDIIGNDIIRNCNIEITNGRNGIVCYGYNQSESFIPYSNVTIENCNILGNVSNAIIYLSKIHDMKVLNCNLEKCLSSLYGIRFIAQSSDYLNKNIYVKNIIINNDINGNSCENQFYDSITQKISETENSKYGFNVYRGTNASFTNILTLNSNDIQYAIRAGGTSSSQAFTNVYEGNVITNLTNTIDSGTHS